MRQRRLGLVLLAVAFVVGGAFLWLAGEERRSLEGPMRAAVEPAQSEADGSAGAAIDRPAVVAETRRALGDAADQTALVASTRTARADWSALEGRVVDELGRPIENALVLAAEVAKRSSRPFSGSKIEPATTDDQGRFRLELPSGRARLQARASGFAPTTVERLLVAADGTNLDEDIVLHRSAIVMGVVVDDTGAPLEHARIAVGASDLAPARTRVDGTFRFDQLERAPITLLVAHANHPPREVELDASQPIELPFVTVRLSRGETIEGRIEGFPAGPLDAWCVVAMQPYSGQPIRSEDRVATVGARGQFRLSGLPADETWHLYAISAEDLDAKPRHPKRVTETLKFETGARHVVLPWVEPGTVSFRVVDATTKAPIERLVVDLGILQRELHATPERLEEYADGRVRLEGRWSEHAEHLTLQVDALQHQRWSRRELLLEPGQQLELGTIELEPVTTMHVTVLDARDDRPVAGVQVGWTEQDMQLGSAFAAARATSADAAHPPWRRRSRGYARHRLAVTDEFGRVSFEGPPGFIVELTATAAGFASAHVTDWKLPERGSAETVVRLEQGGAVDVVATDAAGEPLVGRMLEHRLLGFSFPVGRGHDRPFRIDAERSSQVTDAEGRARFPNLLPGGHEFRIAKRDDSGAVARIMLHPVRTQDEERWTAVAVRAAETSRLVLTESPRGAVFGRITDNGRPLVRATVELVEAQPDPRIRHLARFLSRPGAKAVTTDLDGRYRIDEVEPGDFILRVQPSEYRSTFDSRVTVPVGETQQDVELGTAALAGRVVDPDGNGVADVLVQVGPAEDGQAARAHRSQRTGLSRVGRDNDLFGSQDVRTDATGTFEVRGLPPDVEVVALTGGGNSRWQPAHSETLTLLPGQSRDGLVLVVERGGSLGVRFLGVDASRREVVTTVRLVRDLGTRKDRVFTNMSGSAGTVHALAPGRWTLQMTVARRAEERNANSSPIRLDDEVREVEIVAGQTTEIDILLLD